MASVFEETWVRVEPELSPKHEEWSNLRPLFSVKAPGQPAASLNEQKHERRTQLEGEIKEALAPLYQEYPVLLRRRLLKVGWKTLDLKDLLYSSEHSQEPVGTHARTTVVKGEAMKGRNQKKETKKQKGAGRERVLVPGTDQVQAAKGQENAKA